MKKTCYLTGPNSGVSELANEPETRSVLSDAGFTAIITAADMLEGIDSNAITADEFLRKTVCEIAKCDKVITVPGWELSDFSKKEVQIARLLNIPVENSLTVLKGKKIRIDTP